MARRWPHFLCIGAQKAGTSWLWVQLQQHPQVWMPPIKELHFFDHLYCPENRSWTGWHIKTSVQRILKQHLGLNNIDLNYVHYLSYLATQNMFTPKWYSYAFSRPRAEGKTLGDITPEYSTLPEEGVSYVAELLGDIKIIYIIRDPVERAMSQLRMNVQRQGPADTLDLAAWMDHVKAPAIVNRGDYINYIPRWKKYFKEENILFIPFGKITTSSEELLSDVSRFLGVEQWHGYKRLNDKIHQTNEMIIPEEAINYLKDEARPQLEYLIKTFGDEFVSQTS